MGSAGSPLHPTTSRTCLDRIRLRLVQNHRLAVPYVHAKRTAWYVYHYGHKFSSK